MPLLLPFGQFTSTRSLKSVYFAAVTRLAPLLAFLRMPASAVHWLLPPHGVPPRRCAAAAQRRRPAARQAVSLARGSDQGTLEHVAGQHGIDDKIGCLFLP